MKKVFVSILLLLYLHDAYSQNREYDSLKNLMRSEKDDSTRFNVTSDLIWDYIYSYPDSALKYIQQNIFLEQKIKSDFRLAVIYDQYGSLEQVNGDYPMALQYMFKSSRPAERTHNYFLICDINIELSDIYKESGDFDNAMYYQRKAKFIFESHQNIKSTNVTYWNMINTSINLHLAQIYERFNHLDSALKYANSTYNQYLKVNDRIDLPPVFYTLGNIYSKMGNYPIALSNYRKGVAIADKKDLMDCYSGIAITFRKIGQLDSSILNANKVLELSKVAHNTLVKLDALKLLADIYKLKQNADSTSKYLELTIITKDSLFSQQKIMQVQSISFNEQLSQQELQQKIEQSKLQYKNRLNIYTLLAGLLILIIVVAGLWRRNIYRKKSFVLLQKQKQETDNQKLKVETTLEELKATQAQLIQSEKMASLGELTAGIAHEIQNPLNFVNNFSEVNNELVDEINNETDIGEIKAIANDIKQNSEKILFHGKRADSIVKGMLQHSRQTKGIKEPTDINALCDEYLRLSYHGLRAKDKSFNADFKTDFDQSIGKMNIVPQDIGRVLLNLFNNAFYAVNEKQKLMANGYQPTAKVSTRTFNNAIEIKVEDNGNGIPSNIIDKIFQPFFTTKPTGQGTGLGLSLAYDIITKEHNGSIKVESKEGEGTTFMIHLPVA